MYFCYSIFIQKMGKTYVIGDIHGGLRALQQVLERAAVTEKDKLFLGFTNLFISCYRGLAAMLEPLWIIGFMPQPLGKQVIVVASYENTGMRRF